MKKNRNNEKKDATTDKIIAFTGGSIMTMDPGKEDAEAIVIQNDRIVDVGDKEILRSYNEFELIDLNGQTLIPAFIDAHNHLSFGCLLQKGANLRGVFKKEDVLQKIKDHVQDHSGSGWVIAYPWMDVQQGAVNLPRTILTALIWIGQFC
ncbi:hypothetical protein GCM10025860_04410 [Methanobacterium ferruginis]|nr:amidohydrolase family protein [Methanobacterium ferruginis]BDZ66993.1 hypothetical protein GCM10025860_04410 [Methanobacterium ferruginis]